MSSHCKTQEGPSMGTLKPPRIWTGVYSVGERRGRALWESTDEWGKGNLATGASKPHEGSLGWRQGHWLAQKTNAILTSFPNVITGALPRNIQVYTEDWNVSD